MDKRRRIIPFLPLALLVMSACPGEKPAEDEYAALRQEMVEQQIIARGIKDPKVLQAMGSVRRHLFVPPEHQSQSYADYPLPIGEDQTISQPYIVALMTELAQINEHSRALEIGTGSGYQAAVLAEIASDVYTIEILEPLGSRAEKRLTELGYKNVHVRIGDGYKGWPEAAPFDAILVTAAPDHIPQPLVDQLKPGGRLVIPVGEGTQELQVITKAADGAITNEAVAPVRFVPMTGEAEKR